ncbi:hypothetical protein D3C80_1511290 [compost metagenome]
MAVATGGDFVGDVMHFQQGGVRFGFGDKGPHALHADQETFGGQFAQRTVDGHATDAKLGHQFTFRGDALVR